MGFRSLLRMRAGDGFHDKIGPAGLLPFGRWAHGERRREMALSWFGLLALAALLVIAVGLIAVVVVMTTTRRRQ
jgi:hypothetical protein